MVRSDNGAGVASKPFLRRLLVAIDGSDAGLTATADVVHGTSVVAIVCYENADRFDAVVIGTEAKTGLERVRRSVPPAGEACAIRGRAA